jgi:ABC-type branched-subunit amino acid transport system substrate-binding protein
MMKKFKIAFFVVLIALVVIFIFRSNEYVSEYKIGFIGSLTGDLASLGEEARNSTELAVKKLKGQGRDIKVVYQDGKCSINDGISAAKRLIDIEKINIILGGVCSTETLAFLPLIEKIDGIVFTSWALNPDITQKHKNVFRNAPSDNQGAYSVADLAHKKNVGSISIITENTDYTNGFHSIFLNRFQGLGGKVIHDESFNPQAKDLKSIIKKSIESNPDAILINAQGANTGVIAKQLYELGYKNQIFGNIYLVDGKILNDFGKYLEGAYTSEPANLDANDRKVAEFINDYEKEYGKKPVDLFWSAASFDAVNIVDEAVRNVGNDTEKIYKYIHNIESYDGLLGKYKFDERGDVVGIRFQDKIIKAGKAINI